MVKIQSITNPFHVSAPDENGFMAKFLGLINPTSLAAFLAFFGITGIIATETFPLLNVFTLLPALIGGFVMKELILSAMSYAFARAYSSSAVDVQDLIGRVAEVTIPIPAGRTGEIQYIAGSKRFNSPAKCKNPEQELPRGSKVMILETGDKCMLVDLWTDSFQDPDYDDNTVIHINDLKQEKQV